MQSRKMLWIGLGVGVAGLTAALAYVIFRLASNNGTREDPTTQRIQQLIDEANSLLKALDEQRHSA
jgi:membrane protein implicated in regulation of membrane protease activity